MHTQFQLNLKNGHNNFIQFYIILLHTYMHENT